MWHSTARALGQTFDTSELRVVLGDDVRVLRVDEKSLNNALRDLPGTPALMLLAASMGLC